MRKFISATALLAICLTMAINGQTDPKKKGLDAITLDAIKGQLEFLASDWTEGRATGEKGDYLAGDYVASMFKVFGVAGGGDLPPGPRVRGNEFIGARDLERANRSYFQNFTLIESISTGPSSLTVKRGNREITFEEGVDYGTIRANMTTQFESQVVFVGYGMVDKAVGINDFAGVDMKGKIIIRLAGFPGYDDPQSAIYKKLTDGRTAMEIMRNKNTALEGLDIAGIIDVTPGADIAKRWGVMKEGINLAYGESRVGRTNYPGMRLDGKEVPLSPVNMVVTERVANFMLQGSGIDLNKFISDAAAGTLKFKPVSMPGLSVVISTQVNTRRVKVRNVVAMIEGENPNEFVVVGAHIDHMGMEAGKVWNGADDNASGTVGVIMIAKAVAATGVKPKKSILFCAWTGEEKGLLGSEYFTRFPPMGKISDVKFYLNYDMIGRDAANDSEKKMAGMTFTNTFPKLEEWSKANIEKYKIDLEVSYRGNPAPTGGSDYSAFTNNKIPVIAWMAAMHPDYHQPSDHVSLINWEKMHNIIRLGFLQVWDAANNELK